MEKEIYYFTEIINGLRHMYILSMTGQEVNDLIKRKKLQHSNDPDYDCIAVKARG